MIGPLNLSLASPSSRSSFSSSTSSSERSKRSSLPFSRSSISRWRSATTTDLYERLRLLNSEALVAAFTLLCVRHHRRRRRLRLGHRRRHRRERRPSKRSRASPKPVRTSSRSCSSASACWKRSRSSRCGSGILHAARRSERSGDSSRRSLATKLSRSMFPLARRDAVGPAHQLRDLLRGVQRRVFASRRAAIRKRREYINSVVSDYDRYQAEARACARKPRAIRADGAPRCRAVTSQGARRRFERDGRARGAITRSARRPIDRRGAAERAKRARCGARGRRPAAVRELAGR